MAGLAIDGDPDTWLDTGYSINALAARLEGELSDANAFGPQALARSWYGPAADAFNADWATRRARYEDLIDLVRRAAGAISAYGGALREVQEHARVLEYTFCAAGLVVSPEGFFALPVGLELLPSPIRTGLEKTLSDALREVENLGIDAAAGVVALALGLNPVIALLAEFALNGLGSGVISEVGHEFMQVARDPVTASLIGAVPDLTKDLEGVLPDSTLVSGVAEDGGPVMDVVTGLDATWDVVHDAWHEGYLASFEQNAGGLVSAAVGMGIGALAGDALAGVTGAAIGAGLAAVGVTLAPEIVAGVAIVAIVGVAVAVGIVAGGVGNEVQTVVDDHKQAINNAVDVMGQGADAVVHDDEDTAEPTGKDITERVGIVR